MPTLKARIGGVWVDVGGGGGTDEVWISDTAPAGTTQELWYDTDEPNLFAPDTARWNSAWGVVATTNFSSPGFNVTNTWTTAGVPPITATTVVGRRYRLIIDMRAWGPASANVDCVLNVSIWNGSTAGSPISSGLMDAYAYSFYQWDGFHYSSMFFNGDGAVHTFTAAFMCAQAVVAVYPVQLYLEDVGPVSMASNPPAQPASVWTNMALLNGWTNVGGGNTPGQYRLLGDVVQIRGELAYAPGFANPFAVLPVGMRPSTVSNFPIANNTSATAALRLYVDTGGGMGVSGITGNTQFGLGMVSFSVTP